MRTSVFDELVRRYDEWYDKHLVTFKNELSAIKYLGIEDPALEVGVGTGRFSSVLNIAYGLDPSIEMLLRARARGVEVVAGVGEYLPVRSHSLGTVLIIDTLPFVSDQAKVIEEARRVLRSGGKLVVCFIPRDSRWGKYYEGIKDKDPFYSKAKFLTLEDVLRLIKEAGLRFTRCSSTLRKYGPRDPEVPEEPSSECLGGGFTCVEAVKD